MVDELAVDGAPIFREVDAELKKIKWEP